MYDKLLVAGRLGSDPIMRVTPQGTSVASFSVATSRKYKTADGEQKEQVTWYRITAWNKLAEICNEYLKKGSSVLIEGTLSPDTDGSPRIWTDKEGKPRASYEVRANEVRFLGGKPNEQTESTTEASDF